MHPVLIVSLALALGPIPIGPEPLSAAQRGRGEPTQQPAPRARSTGTEPDESDDVDRQVVDIALRYFEICDVDDDGFISYREARDGLGVKDHAAFEVYDSDRDGLSNLDEFRARYDAVIARGGAFAPPRNASAADLAGEASGSALLEAFDLNADRRLERREIEIAFGTENALDLDIAMMLEELDEDGSQHLEGRELLRLSPLLEGEVEKYLRERPKSIHELFGMPAERDDVEAGSVPEPPLIAGPVAPFRRLDLDHDGGITTQDLLDLLRPLRTPVRLQTLMASLDTDGDGSISQEEFRNSMQPPHRGR